MTGHRCRLVHVAAAAGLAALAIPVSALAQATAPASATAEPPAIRRWLDVQAVQAGLRYRVVRNSSDAVTTDGLQWHGLTRGRVLFDAGGKFSLTMTAVSGRSFVASWNDTGVGTGDFAGTFLVRQLFLSAAPVAGLELQVGGLGPNRGEVSEHISYDMDGYLVGQRVTVRPSAGPLTQISATIGHFAVPQPNVFRRLDDSFDYNYGQVLVGVRLTPRLTASIDYTHEDRRDILRQAVVFRLPPAARFLSSVRVEASVLTGAPKGNGVHTSADLKFGKLLVTAGVMSVDRAYVPVVNGDRYGIGKRWYSLGTYPLNGDVALTWFHTRAFNNTFPVPVHHRFDLIVIINPTARLQRAGIF